MLGISQQQIAKEQRAGGYDNKKYQAQRDRTCKERILPSAGPPPVHKSAMGSRAEFVGNEQSWRYHSNRFRQDREQGQENDRRVPNPPLIRGRGSPRPQPRNKGQDHKHERDQVFSRRQPCKDFSVDRVNGINDGTKHSEHWRNSQPPIEEDQQRCPEHSV